MKRKLTEILQSYLQVIAVLIIASLCFGFCSSLRVNASPLALKCQFQSYFMNVNCSILEQEGQTCIADRYCDSGLHCETCLANGNVRPRCTRIQPLNPISKVQYYSFYPFFDMILHFVCIKVKKGYLIKTG